MAWYNELPIVGGLAGAIFGNPEEEAHQAALKKAQQDMMRYRPDAMETNMNVMGNMAHAFQPMNNMMGQVYGPQAQMDWGKMIQNPFSDKMQEGMVQQAFTPQVDMSKYPKELRPFVQKAQDRIGATDRAKAGY